MTYKREINENIIYYIRFTSGRFMTICIAKKNHCKFIKQANFLEKQGEQAFTANVLFIKLIRRRTLKEPKGKNIHGLKNCWTPFHWENDHCFICGNNKRICPYKNGE